MPDVMSDEVKAATTPWLVRISEAFDEATPEILRSLGAITPKKLGAEFWWIETKEADAIHRSPAAVFLRWKLPLSHKWPCNPSKMPDFIEKAARGLQQKFVARNPQAVFVGALNPGSPDRWFKNLAANLRDVVAKQLPSCVTREAEDQNPNAETLFALVGKEGLFSGMAAPRDCGGFHAGGGLFISTSGEGIISRAGAKIAEALHFLRLHRPALPKGARWLELGACPGGMTSELLRRDFHVTAIDVAKLDPRIAKHPLVKFVQANVAEYTPKRSDQFDALLCDMNGPPADSISQVVRLARTVLKPGGIAIFTLKLPRVRALRPALALLDETIATASRGGLRLIITTHLTANRHELTIFFEKQSSHSVTVD